MAISYAQREYIHADNVARRNAYKKYNESPMRKVENAAMFVGLPVVASLGVGAMQGYGHADKIVKDVAKKTGIPTIIEGSEGELAVSDKKLARLFGLKSGKSDKFIAGSFTRTSRKLGVAARSLKGWGVAIAGGFAGMKLINNAVNDVKPVREFRQEHPTATAIGSMAGVLGAIYAANPVIDKASELIGKISTSQDKNGIKNTVAGRTKRGLAKVARKLENGKTAKAFDKHVLSPMGDFLVKNPVGRRVAEFALPALLIGYVGKAIADSNKIQKDRKNMRKVILSERMSERKSVLDGIKTKLRAHAKAVAYAKAHAAPKIAPLQDKYNVESIVIIEKGTLSAGKKDVQFLSRKEVKPAVKKENEETDSSSKA